MDQKKIKVIENQLGLRFFHPELLVNAFIHRSYLNEHPAHDQESNERLEFLGDAVLELIVSKLLYEQLPEYPEGKLTNIRSLLVRTTTLAELTRDLQIGDYLLMSRGEADLGGRENTSLLANLFEAVVGSVYLDQGFIKAEKLVLPLLKPRLKTIVENQSFKDAKSLFQEAIQEKNRITPEYKVVTETGPDHAKLFTVGLWVGEKLWAKGKGHSKQEAEEKAAESALKKFSKDSTSVENKRLIS